MATISNETKVLVLRTQHYIKRAEQHGKQCEYYLRYHRGKGEEGHSEASSNQAVAEGARAWNDRDAYLEARAAAHYAILAYQIGEAYLSTAGLTLIEKYR